MNRRAMTAAAALAALCLGTAFAEAPSVEARVQEALGEGGVETLRLIERRNPSLHRKVRRLLALAFEELGGRGLPLGRAKRLLGDPKVREVLVRNLDARHRVKELLRRYDESPGARKEALKTELRAAVAECYEARLAAQELRLEKLGERLREAKAGKEAKVTRTVASLTQE